MMKSTPFRRTSWVFAACAIISHSAAANIVCEGSYEFFSGKSTATALPGKAPVNGELAAKKYNNREGWIGLIIRQPQSEGLHEVEVSQCGRQFVLSQGNKKMLFLQSVMDDTLYVAQDIGTNNAELTLRVVDHKIMIGDISGETQGFAFNFPVAMDPRDISMPDMKGCYDDPAPEEVAQDDDRLLVDPELRSEAIEIVADKLGIPLDEAERYISSPRTVANTHQSDEAVTEVLPGEPGCPIQLTGIKTCRIYPPSTTTIVEANLLLDEDGRLLPVTTEGSDSHRVRVDDPAVIDATDVCAQKPEPTLPPADKRLRFKFLAIEEDGRNDVQTILADAETSIAEKAHYAEGKYMGHQGRVEAADEAYRAVGTPVSGRH